MRAASFPDQGLMTYSCHVGPRRAFIMDILLYTSGKRVGEEVFEDMTDKGKVVLKPASRIRLMAELRPASLR